jgi:hypothetical protein
LPDGPLVGANDLLDFLGQQRKLGFDDVPDELVVYLGVTVNQDNPERDDLPMVGDYFCYVRAELASRPRSSPMTSN